MMLHRTLIAWLLILCIAPQPLWAWNNTGHMLVALIAYRKLSNEGQAKAALVLKQHPHYRAPVQFFTAQQPAGVTEDEWAFIRAATWPDFVRPHEGEPRPDIDKFHRPQWHFINLPYIYPPEQNRFAGQRLEAPTPNAVTVLVTTAAAIRDPTTENDELLKQLSADQIRAVRLCWLLHVVGDIHQPLHCAALVSQKFMPPEWDRGGNLLAVRVGNQEPIRLHTYWDDLLGTTEHYASLSAIADEVITEEAPATSPAADFNAAGTYMSWANESVALAKKNAYLDGMLPVDRWPEGQRSHPDSPDVPKLSEDYQTRAKEVARAQVRKAGLRLALAIGKLLPAE